MIWFTIIYMENLKDGAWSTYLERLNQMAEELGNLVAETETKYLMNTNMEHCGLHKHYLNSTYAMDSITHKG